MEHALICPQCKAPLTPHRFSRQVICSYCGTTVKLEESAVSADLFHEAWKTWNSPDQYAFGASTSIGERHWAVESLIAQGESCEIHTGRLARWPTELVLIKVLRAGCDGKNLENEWDILQSLQLSPAKGSETFLRLIPQPIQHGTATAGAFAGRQMSVFRWASGFHHNLTEVIKAYPNGIDPRASIWVWRRILEVLAFLHATGMGHGAILPYHLLVQKNEHGIRLVGYGHAGWLTDPLGSLPDADLMYYPDFARSLPKYSEQLDIVMSARCIIHLLGGNPQTAELPQAVPALLNNLLKRTALAGRDDPAIRDAWQIHQELGSISAQAFGPASFNPIVMPD